MKKRITIFCVCSILLSATPAFSNNLLLNPNFENGVLADWNQFGPLWVADTTAPFEGNISAKNTVVDLGINHFASLDQTVSISTDTVYATLQARPTINPKAFARIGLEVRLFNGGGQEVAFGRDETGGTTDWEQLYVSVSDPAAATAEYKIVVFASADEASSTTGLAFGATGLFDEAVLSEDFIAPPPPLTEISSSEGNGSFENGYVGWDLVFIPGLSIDDDSFDGQFSAKMSFILSGADNFLSASEDVAYFGGPIFAEAHMKTNIDPASTTGLGRFVLESLDSSGLVIGAESKTLQGINDWTRLVLDGAGAGIVPPVGTETVRVTCLAFADQSDAAALGGTVQCDKVIVTSTPLPPDFPTDLVNGGFENSLNGWSNIFGFPATISTNAHTGLFAALKPVDLIEGQDYFSKTFQRIYFDSFGNLFPLNTFVNAESFIETKFDPTTKNKAGLQIEYFDNAATSLGVVEHLDGGITSYGRRYVSGTTPANTAYVEVNYVDFSRESDAALGGESFGDDFLFSLTPLPKIPLPKAVINPGFENGINGDGTNIGWVEDNKPAEVETNPAIVFNGNYSARFEVDSETIPTGIDYFGTVSQDIKVAALQKVSAQAMGKIEASPATPTAATLTLAFFDNDENQIGPSFADAIFASTDWSLLKITQQVAPSGTAFARVTCSLFANKDNAVIGDDAWFDDVKVTVKGPMIKRGPATSSKVCPKLGPCP